MYRAFAKISPFTNILGWVRIAFTMTSPPNWRLSQIHNPLMGVSLKISLKRAHR